MNPFPALSNTWKPLMNSSVGQLNRECAQLSAEQSLLTGSSGRLPAVRTVEDLEELVVVDCVLANRPSVDLKSWCAVGSRCPLVERASLPYRLHSQVAPISRSRAKTSAWVGFWPSERRSSPRDSRGTSPVPFLSKSAKASRYSVKISLTTVVVCLQQGTHQRCWERTAC